MRRTHSIPPPSPFRHVWQATRDPRTGELQHTKAAYTITIGSVETFEKQLEEVQRLLEIDPRHFIPVTYTTLPDWG